MRILLDMDEVLADFVGGVFRHWSVPAEKVMKHWKPGVFDVVEPLGKAIGVDPLSEAEFWRHTDKEGFWAGLPVLPWAHDLIDLVKDVTDDWYVVTSPSRGLTCVPEKQKWLNEFFWGWAMKGDWFDRMIPTSHKHLLVSKTVPTLLIDDRDHNIDMFRAAGGEGILFPRHHNRLSGVRDAFGHVVTGLNQLVKQGRM